MPSLPTVFSLSYILSIKGREGEREAARLDGLLLTYLLFVISLCVGWKGYEPGETL